RCCRARPRSLPARKEEITMKANNKSGGTARMKRLVSVLAAASLLTVIAPAGAALAAGPVITSVSPSCAPPGTVTLTLAGSGFKPTGSVRWLISLLGRISGTGGSSTAVDSDSSLTFTFSSGNHPLDTGLDLRLLIYDANGNLLGNTTLTGGFQFSDNCPTSSSGGTTAAGTATINAGSLALGDVGGITFSP